MIGLVFAEGLEFHFKKRHSCFFKVLTIVVFEVDKMDINLTRPDNVRLD